MRLTSTLAWLLQLPLQPLLAPVLFARFLTSTHRMQSHIGQRFFRACLGWHFTACQALGCTVTQDLMSYMRNQTEDWHCHRRHKKQGKHET